MEIYGAQYKIRRSWQGVIELKAAQTFIKLPRFSLHLPSKNMLQTIYMLYVSLSLQPQG